jgi:uncharacterized protein YjdB
MGSTAQLSARVLATDGGELPERVPSWSSADPAIATVNETGVVTGLALGSTTINAEVEDVTGTVTLVVDPPPLTGLEIRPAEVELTRGETFRLRAIGRAENVDSVPGLAIQWSSADENIATIDAGGLLSAVGVGETAVTAAFGDQSATAVVTVLDKVAATVTVEPGSADILVHETVQLTATARDEDGEVLNKTFAWSSSKNSVASVNDAGLVTGEEEGTAYVIATVDGVRDSARVRVAPRPVADVRVVPEDVTIVLAEEVRLRAILTTDEGEEVDRPVEWSSSNAAVASVSSSGLVTGLLPGEATITATAEGESGTATVRVELPPLTGIEVRPGSLDLEVDETATLSAVGLQVGGGEQPDLDVTWESADPSIASVDGDGQVKGLSSGTTSVTATFEGFSDAATVTVYEPIPTSISVEPASLTLQVDETATLTATVLDQNGDEMDAAVTWTSTDEDVATVDASGLVTAEAVGDADIRASVGDLEDSAEVTVEPPPPVSRVEVLPAVDTIAVGQSLQLVATLYDAGDNEVSGRPVAWSSSQPLRATVNSSGLVTALVPNLGDQHVTITATSEGVSGTAMIRVVLLAGSAVPEAS